MSKKLTKVGGDKGGVGKTETAKKKAEAEYHKGNKVVAVDCDTSNPDYARFIQKNYPDIPVHLIDTRNEQGFVELLNIVEQAPADAQIVMNMPAGTISYVEKHKDLLTMALDEMGVPLDVIFVLGKTSDSVALLKKYMEVMGDSIASIRVVTNGYFGDADKFHRWNESKLKKDLEKNNIVTMAHYPDVDQAYMFIEERTGNKTPMLMKALEASDDPSKKLTIAERMIVKRAVEAAHEALGV